MSAPDQQPTRVVPVVRDRRPSAPGESSGGAPDRGARARRTTTSAALPERSVRQAGSRHATMVALVGFYVGMALTIAAPLTFAAVFGAPSSAVDSADGAASSGRLLSYAPLLVLLLAVPLVLIVVPRTRRLGRYLLLGMVSTALVVGVVGGGVLWILISTS